MCIRDSNNDYVPSWVTDTSSHSVQHLKEIPSENTTTHRVEEVKKKKICLPKAGPREIISTEERRRRCRTILTDMCEKDKQRSECIMMIFLTLIVMMVAVMMIVLYALWYNRFIIITKFQQVVELFR